MPTTERSSSDNLTSKAGEMQSHTKRVGKPIHPTEKTAKLKEEDHEDSHVPTQSSRDNIGVRSGRSKRRGRSGLSILWKGSIDSDIGSIGLISPTRRLRYDDYTTNDEAQGEWEDVSLEELWKHLESFDLVSMSIARLEFSERGEEREYRMVLSGVDSDSETVLGA